MALTATQRASVRYFLGWPARYFSTSSGLEMAMDALAEEAESETLVIALLASCVDIDTKLLSAHGRLKAAQVGSIQLPGAQEIQALRNEGRRFVGRIAAHLGVEPMFDVFGRGRGTRTDNETRHG